MRQTRRTESLGEEKESQSKRVKFLLIPEPFFSNYSLVRIRDVWVLDNPVRPIPTNIESTLSVDSVIVPSWIGNPFAWISTYFVIRYFTKIQLKYLST